MTIPENRKKCGGIYSPTLLLVALLCFWFFSGVARAHRDSPHIVFLNPGHAHESFWGDVDRFMSAAATQLDLRLTTLHGERDVFKTLDLGTRIARMEPPPDYLILVNEMNTGPRLMEITQNLDTQVMFILNDLSPEDKEALNHLNGGDSRLVGSLIPDNHWVGYETARALHHRLLKQGGKEHYRWIALSGDDVTPASVQREQGMRAYVGEHEDLTLLNTVYAYWEEEQGYQVTRQLLKRFGSVDGIWTANDHMACGAIRALKEAAWRPGHQVFVSSVNSSQKVLDALERGVVSALGAGHFMTGGWSLVMIHDHWHQRPAAEQIHLQQPLFQLVEPQGAFYRILRSSDWKSYPFSHFSRVLNTDKWPGYHFLDPTLELLAPTAKTP